MSSQLVSISNAELPQNTYPSNLMADYAVGASAITVYSISQFAVNQILLIGEIGNQDSEIIKTHAATAPTGNTVTLASNLVKAHPKDTVVRILSFDQIEFWHADTVTGVKTQMGSSTTIDPGEDEMLYNDTTYTSGYYFSRYKNTITTTYSDYSDPLPYEGMALNTVGYAIDTAMNELHLTFSDKLTFSMMIGFARQMLALVRGKLKSWRKYQEYDYNFGTISQGVRRYAVPATLYDKNSNRSILTLRIGNEAPLTPIDREEYVRLTKDMSYTEVSTQAVASDTALVLDDTSDLDDTGAVYVYVSGTKYTVEYTANDRTTNTLTVASDQITVTLPVDSPVWQGVEEDTPTSFNISDGYLYIFPMIGSTFEGRNITGDFYTDIETIDSQADVILGTKADMLIPYLKFKARAITENSGMEDLNDPSYQEFRELLNDARSNDGSAEEDGFHPRSRGVRNTRDYDLTI